MYKEFLFLTHAMVLLPFQLEDEGPLNCHGRGSIVAFLLSHGHFQHRVMKRDTRPSKGEAVAGANTTLTSPTSFGLVNVVDNTLTKGPKPTSKLIGRGQGFFASSSQSEISFFMAIDFVFMEGKFNGSTLTMVGRNPIMHKEREMTVVGGSGAFRLARGYAIAKTFVSDQRTKNAIVEYHITVIHF
ncbi:hypothetical protein AMTR_s00041p00181310 [Amborella trichopoda]|uniref:Dirigent protein n=1 Tax=Amborella trichopoda TaxID=13333 RepID=W1PTP8_AMBTC|nr:hypothetical protein AMTR_s00041p00181310 [Amborella trichopoda]